MDHSYGACGFVVSWKLNYRAGIFWRGLILLVVFFLGGFNMYIYGVLWFLQILFAFGRKENVLKLLYRKLLRLLKPELRCLSALPINIRAFLLSLFFLNFFHLFPLSLYVLLYFLVLKSDISHNWDSSVAVDYIIQIRFRREHLICFQIQTVDLAGCKLGSSIAYLGSKLIESDTNQTMVHYFTVGLYFLVVRNWCFFFLGYKGVSRGDSDFESKFE